MKHISLAAVLFGIVGGSLALAGPEWPFIVIDKHLPDSDIVALVEVKQIYNRGQGEYRGQDVGLLDVAASVALSIKGDVAAGAPLTFRHYYYEPSIGAQEGGRSFANFEPEMMCLVFLQHQQGHLRLMVPRERLVTLSAETLGVLKGLPRPASADDYLVDILLAVFFGEDSVESCRRLITSATFLKRARVQEKLQSEFILRMAKLHDLLENQVGDYKTDEYISCFAPRHHTYVFFDAIGEPIPKAEVEVFSNEEEGAKRSVGKYLLDESGILRVPRESLEGRSTFVLSHPDYGIASIEKDEWKRAVLWVPLVRAGTEADKNSIRGVIADDANSPIAGALVSCRMVYTPGGGKMNWDPWYGTVITDQQGRFAMCMPTYKLRDGPTEIPPHSKYEVSIRIPKAYLLGPYSCKIPTSKETQIKLTRAERYFRSFVFEDANGPITDEARLDRLFLGIKPPGQGHLEFRYAELKDGGIFPVGEYVAWIRGPAGKTSLRFEAMEVTEASPEQLVFKAELPGEVTYLGQAVLGFTDEPAAGAFVAVQRQPRVRIVAIGSEMVRDGLTVAMITDEQWEQLHELGRHPPLNAPAVEPLKRIWEIDKIVRADDDGRFQIGIPKAMHKRGSFDFSVFMKGMMPVCHPACYFQDDPDEDIHLPMSRLFEAGTVSFYIVCEQEQRSQVRMRYEIGSESGAEWVGDFLEYRSTGGVSFPLNRSIWCNYRYMISVPAGLEMQLLFQMRKDNLWSPVYYSEPFAAQQGQVVDLGSIDVTAKMPVYVQLIDSAGNLIGGVGVAHWAVDRKRYFGQTHITDEEGIAEFHVPPYYRGTFCVGYLDPNNNCVGESVAYETRGPEDANNVYTLRLSDEMVKALFK